MSRVVGSRPVPEGTTMAKMKTLARRTAFLVAASLLALAAIAPAAGPTLGANEKYFVCKYVGTPGVDEVLQTGQNPISVSVNAIPDFQGVGSFFQDSQGRSYVLAQDTGQPEPPVSDCPPPNTPTPTPTPTPAPTATPSPTPGGGVAADTSAPTLPPTDTSSASGSSSTNIGLVFSILAGVLASILVLTPDRIRRR
jgi:hypothetical protein